MKYFNLLTGTQALIYRVSGGRLGGKWKGRNPILLLDHVGAKSGQTRTTPLAYTEHEGDLLIVASRGGSPSHPGWFHNLRANPATTVQVGKRRISVTARVAGDEERARVWPMLVEANPDYGEYEGLTDRKFPVVVLTPADPAG
jgi:deazaflavin-dependent oxidoreductase (nitroreductase family)